MVPCQGDTERTCPPHWPHSHSSGRRMPLPRFSHPPWTPGRRLICLGSAHTAQVTGVKEAPSPGLCSQPDIPYLGRTGALPVQARCGRARGGVGDQEEADGPEQDTRREGHGRHIHECSRHRCAGIQDEALRPSGRGCSICRRQMSRCPGPRHGLRLSPIVSGGVLSTRAFTVYQ